MPTTALASALRLSDLGYQPLLIRPGSKVPLERFRGRPPPSRDELVRTLRRQPRLNIAIRLPGLVALDADDQEAKAVLSEMPETPIMQISPRGGEHRLFRLPEGVTASCRIRIGSIGLDLKTGANSYLLFSPSYSAEHRRRYELVGELVRPEELPVLDPGVLPRGEEEKRREPVPVRIIDTGDVLRRVVAYAEKCGRVAPSISGSNGHTAAFRFGCNILRAIPGMTKDHLRVAFDVFNQFCIPEWSRKELDWKIEQCWIKTRGG